MLYGEVCGLGGCLDIAQHADGACCRAVAAVFLSHCTHDGTSTSGEWCYPRPVPYPHAALNCTFEGYLWRQPPARVRAWGCDPRCRVTNREARGHVPWRTGW